MGQEPSHEQIASDYNVSFGPCTMTHVLNYLDDEPSAHHIMRNLFIDIVCRDLDTPYKSSMKCFNFAELPLSLIEKLRTCIDGYNIEFDWSWVKADLQTNPHHTYSDYPYNDETQKKWEIERDYLFHWLDKVKDGSYEFDETKSVLQLEEDDKGFVTDGERIASIYKQQVFDVAEKHKIEYHLYKPYKIDDELEYELIGSYHTIKKSQDVYGEIIEREFPNVEKVLLEMEREHPQDDNEEWGSKIRSLIHKRNGFTLCKKLPVSRLLKSDLGFYPGIIVKTKIKLTEIS